MEKMGYKEQVQTRAMLYDIVAEDLYNHGYNSEPVKGGRLIDLGNGYHGKVTISICDPDKIEKYREEYKEQLRKNAEAAQLRADKAAEKAAKA